MFITILLYESLAVAVLVFLTGSAWTWVVTADLLFGMDRNLGFLLSVGDEIVAVGIEMVHVPAAFRSPHFTGFVVFTKWDEGSEQEGQGVSVEFLQHGGEEVVAFDLVDDEWVFLFVACILYGFTEVVHVTEMLFPFLVDLPEDDVLAESFGEFLTL